MGVYLDHNATTPLDARVLDAMLPYLRDHYGNPSSVHRYGRVIRSAIDRAREQLAALLNVSPAQVVFTSGGTEANNLAIKGLQRYAGRGRGAVSAVEHASVLAAARHLEAGGSALTVLDVDGQGRLTEAALARIDSDTAWVSVMMANNETGVIEDLARVAERTAAVGALLHTDAVQALGKIRVDFAATGVQLMSLSAHKIHGPKGVGALVFDRGVELQPLLHGGGQESGLRSGTENVAAIVGFGRAAELAADTPAQEGPRLLELRRYLEHRLAEFDALTVFGAAAERLPNTCLIGVPGIDGEALLMGLDEQDIAVSSGSACDSHSRHEASHVLLAMGVDEELARTAVRVSLGRENTRRDVDRFVAALGGQIEGLRSLSLRAWG